MMTPAFAYPDNSIRLYHGDVLSVSRGLAAESVQCIVTSPPYWGLRDYGVEPLIWDGEDGCVHEWGEYVTPAANGIVHEGGMSGVSLSGSSATRKPKRSEFCRLCGAWRGSLGLEPMYTLFIEHLVQIFRELRRVLRKDGTLWLNMGDSYASGKGTCHNPGGNTSSFNVHLKEQNVHPLDRGNVSTLRAVGLKPKDLLGLPWRVALALQADGWWLRSDIIWAKPGPMPSSVNDRPTMAHEYLFLLTKSARYFYDAEAIKEPAVTPGDNRHLRADNKKEIEPMSIDNGSRKRTGNPTGEMRNKRTVWTISTQPFPEAHFATFPEALVTPCILAGSRHGDVVFDPFAGSGTTLAVARRLGRLGWGCELNAEYIEMARRRVDRETAGMGFDA